MSKTTANISIDSDVKAKAQALFADLGMDLSTAVNIFLRQAVRMNSLPFEVTRNIPNSTTVSAINEYYEMLENPKNYKKYSSFKDVLSEVLDNA